MRKGTVQDTRQPALIDSLDPLDLPPAGHLEVLNDRMPKSSPAIGRLHSIGTVMLLFILVKPKQKHKGPERVLSAGGKPAIL